METTTAKARAPRANWHWRFGFGRSKANRYSNTPQALADYLGLTKGTVSQTLLLLDRR